jgi:surface protein
MENTSKVTNMNNMFANCIKLEALPNINNWKTYSLKEHNYMFYNCPNINNIPIKFKNM